MKAIWPSKLFCTALIFAVIQGFPEVAMTADIHHWQAPHEQMLSCSIDGPLGSEDFAKIQVAGAFGCRMLHLNSPGGSVDVALAMGEVIRKHQMHVFIDPDKTCASACVLLFAAGIVRIPYGPVLIHRPYFEASQISYQETQKRMDQVSVRMKQFLKKMNTSESLFEMMMRVSPEDAKPLTLSEMESLGLGFFDPIYVETRENSRAVKLGMTKQDFLRKKVATATKCGRIDVLVSSSKSEILSACWNREFPGYFGE